MLTTPLVVRWSAGIAAYLALYVALDRASLIEPVGALGITPWNPPAGLSFALLLRYGPRFLPLALLAIVVADFLFRGLSGQPVAILASALAIAVPYALAAAALRARLEPTLRLGRLGDLVMLLFATCVAAAAAALGAVAIFAAFGLLAWSEFIAVAQRFWVGDVIGIVVLTPFLLLFFGPGRARLPMPPRPAAAAEFAGQLVAIAAGLWIIFWAEPADHFEYTYVLFLPLIWTSLRHGLRGASWGIVATQIGLVVAVQLKGYDADVMVQFQLLMLADAVTGLLLGAVVDERRNAVRALRDSESRLHTIVATAPDAILTLGPAGVVESANTAAGRLFGFDPARPDGLSIAALLPGLAGDRLAPASGSEAEARRIDGTAFTAEIAVGRTDDATTPLHVAVVRDITERKKDEARRKRHEAELAHAGRLAASGEMAAALAHEINQPLTAMIGFARACQTVLRQSDAAGPAPDRERVNRLIDQAVAQANRAGDIIRTTREFLRHGEPRQVQIEIGPLFDSVANLVRAEAAYQQVGLVVEPPARLPPVLVDPIQIEQVVLNLVRNAIEAMAQSGTPRRTVTLTAGPATEAGEIEIVVADTGPGVPEAVRDRLFTPFATTKSTGMGLGLSISRSIVEAHGGRIRLVHSGPETGTAIAFTLPIAPDDSHDE